MSNLLPIIKPMLAIKSEPFDSQEYIYEIKWDGYRGLAYLENNTKILSRNQIDITQSFPELQGLHLRLKEQAVILDGEIVVLKEGKPSFGFLQARGRLTDPIKIKRASLQTPAVFIAFDILFKSGQSVMTLTVKQRKDILNEIIKPGDDLVISQYIQGQGVQYFDAACASGLEGIVAKKIDSPYLPGKRSAYWRKIRRVQSIELVIMGWEEGEGRRNLGALILGGLVKDKWVYVGKVGTGFSKQEEEYLLKKLKEIRADNTSLSFSKGEIRRPNWVQPQLVCEVNYTEISQDGRLRHPSYKGLRDDKQPEQCLIPE